MVGAPDAKIMFTKAPLIQYGQILLDKYFFKKRSWFPKRSYAWGFKNTDTKNMK